MTKSATAAGTKVSDNSMRRRQRDDHGERHRVEHLPFDAGQREDRQIHHRDDENAEQTRLHHLGRGARGQLEPLVAGSSERPSRAAPRRAGAGNSRR